MHYKILYHEPKNLIDYAKWLDEQHARNELELVAVNGNYHIFITAQQQNANVRLLVIGRKKEFCWRCGCQKSGWEDVANRTSEHCYDKNCICHIAKRTA